MLKKIVIGVVLNALALYAVTYFLDDITYVGGLKFFLLGGLIIGILNTFVRPLMKLLSFPLVFMTVGLFTLVINAIIFWLTIRLVNGIHLADVSVAVASTWTYFVAALIFGLMNWVIHFFIRNK